MKPFIKKTLKEDYAIILDYLPHGDPINNLDFPIAYAVGKTFFTLLLLSIKEGVNVDVLEEVYIGSGLRPKVKAVLRKVSYDELPSKAKDNLLEALKKIVKENEKLFVEFLNKAGPINIRVHSLELLPGIGKSTLKDILKEREKKPFESFEDFNNRVKNIRDPVEIFAERILSELQKKERIRLFTI